jgi:hypothetical protein
MKNKISVIFGVFACTSLIGAASASASFQERVDQCLEKHANTHDAASVTLQCTAGGGKLSDCKVLDNTAPGRGFDKAAMCVAESLPMGAKTGDIKIPVKFTGTN